MPAAPQTVPTDMSVSSAQKLPLLAWLLLGLSAGWCSVWFMHALGYWEDDAYIHLEFARSLAAGRGFSFNGHIVYGDTSPVWAWLLAAFHAAIPDWIPAGKTLSAVAAVFALTGAFAFARSLTRTALGPAASANFAAFMVLILVTNPYFGYWAFSGMEAIAGAGVVCWCLVLAAPAKLAPARFLCACFLAGVAPLLRPETAFFSALLALLLSVRLYRQAMPLLRRLEVGLAGLVLIAAPFLLWVGYAVRTFGTVLPNTNGAKRAAPGHSVIAHLLKIYAIGFPLVLIGLVLLAAAGVAYAARARGRPRPRLGTFLPAGAWLLFVWTALNCAFYVADHTYVQTRYLFVTAPVLTIAIMATAVQRWPRTFRALAVGGVVFGAGVSLLATWPLIRNKVVVDRVYADLAAFLQSLPPDAPVAHYSIGEAAFLSEHPLIDTGGITRPGIIPFLFDATDDRRLAWMYAQGAQYLVIDHQPLPGAVLVWSEDLPATGWSLNPRLYRTTTKLQVWKLPHAPALR